MNSLLYVDRLASTRLDIFRENVMEQRSMQRNLSATKKARTEVLKNMIGRMR